ncbi:uncharacterized protein MAM_06681 [Metarhizium album ARSEF 1941]|uniref:Protein BIG1 n=1 Tax=Metarhizium album (strain ARSEF 1941) TaxID=1081103 RepID=A0A0B2WP08_METAS|nr:uncharacterized protein MAM_06681 [Metarhizium album ARSEF 1941]KHN95404.1 hypothetical protein MAM_06681 [Metarhizium album ARSEF 1941]
MRFQIFASTFALPGAAFAFSDSSPWVLLSSSKISQPVNTNQIQTSSEVISFTKHVLDECPTDRYLIVTQPGINAADLSQTDCLMPRICKSVEGSRVKGKYTVAEVIGDVTEARLDEYINSACRMKGKTVNVNSVQLGSFSPPTRAQDLASNDASLAPELEAITSSDSYTILLYATPREPLYESEFIEPLHMGMKRDTRDVHLQQNNDTEFNKLPLFQKYQFFTPGIFMALIVAIVFFSIIGAGIRGLASLEVSYGAFDKEMGPAAQKKQQ